MKVCAWLFLSSYGSTICIDLQPGQGEGVGSADSTSLHHLFRLGFGSVGLAGSVSFRRMEEFMISCSIVVTIALSVDMHAYAPVLYLDILRGNSLRYLEMDTTST